VKIVHVLERELIHCEEARDLEGSYGPCLEVWRRNISAGVWGCVLALVCFLTHCRCLDRKFMMQFEEDSVVFHLSSSWHVRELFPSRFEFSFIRGIKRRRAADLQGPFTARLLTQAASGPWKQRELGILPGAGRNAGEAGLIAGGARAGAQPEAAAARQPLALPPPRRAAGVTGTALSQRTRWDNFCSAAISVGSPAAGRGLDALRGAGGCPVRLPEPGTARSRGESGGREGWARAHRLGTW